MYRIVSKERLAHKHTLFTVDAPEIAAKAQAGQFLIVISKEGGERVPLSICGYDREKGTVSFAFHEVGKTTKELGTFDQGEELFAATCAGCHGATAGAGPALVGMADRAATRVEGQSAEEYLHESIVNPGAFVVEGYSNIMPGGYGDQYSDTELDALVAYIMAEGAGEEAAEAEATEEAAEEPTEEAAEPTEEAEPEATETAEAEETAAAGEVAGDPEAGATVFNQACSGCHKAFRAAAN